MKALMLAAVLSLVAHEAMAVEIEGKWGLGAGIFNSRVGDMTLIRGRSDRSAWLFDLRGRRECVDIDGPASGVPVVLSQERSQWFVQGGPGLRSYLRPDDDLSPYWDVAVFAVYRSQRDEGGASVYTSESLGGGARFDLGVEYFTPWKFSIAAHTSLVSATWTSLDYKVVDTSGTSTSSGSQHNVDFGVSTGLGARIYF